ncbi:MAG TPA: hypothetical protein VD963_06745 [Phycisphaerales bacterium]|nr:hypothetical protein [Phycisphaerales bacterium]
MQTRTLALAVVVAGATASVASAQLQPVTIDWKVNGQESVVVAPGASVTVVGYAAWLPSPLVGGFGTALLTADLLNANLTDTLNYTAPGLGRNPFLSLMPQTLLEMPMPGMRMITASTGAIDVAQLPAFINPLFDPSNPIELFRYTFTAGAAGRTVAVGSTVLNASLYDFMGMPVNGAPIVDGASITIVPASGPAALLAVSGLVAARRRRPR